MEIYKKANWLYAKGQTVSGGESGEVSGKYQVSDWAQWVPVRCELGKVKKERVAEDLGRPSVQFV